MAAPILKECPLYVGSIPAADKLWFKARLNLAFEWKEPSLKIKSGPGERGRIFR